MMISSGHKHNNTCFGLRRPRAMSLDSDDEYVTNPSDVPQGFLAVYVGQERSRFVIPMSYLNLPVFRELLDQAAEEFGFVHRGGLTIPCDEEFFKKVLGFIQTRQSKNKPLKPCHDRERENSSMSIKPLLKSSIQRSLA